MARQKQSRAAAKSSAKSTGVTASRFEAGWPKEMATVETVGVYTIKEWRNAAGQLHRAGDRPARVWYEDDVEISVAWHKNGRCHRGYGLPALVQYKDGSIITEQWFRAGKHHRRHDLPAVVYYKAGEKIYEGWCRRGQWHRGRARPARIWYEAGKPTHTEQYRHGVAFFKFEIAGLPIKHPKMAIYLDPLAVIAALRASLDNFVIIKPKDTPGKAGGQTQFFNVKIRLLDGTQHNLMLNVVTPMKIHRGVADPANQEDSRNKFAKDEAGRPKNNSKAQFNLAEGPLRECIELIEEAYMHHVKQFPQYGLPDHFAKQIHTVLDLGRPLVPGEGANKRILLEDPKAFQAEHKYLLPRFTGQLKYDLVHGKHPIQAWRGKPESQICDADRPVVAPNGDIIAFEPVVNLSVANAHEFINDGAEFVRMRLSWASIVYSASWVSMPAVITYAVVKTGIAQDDAPAALDFGSIRPTVTPPQAIVAPIPVVANPADIFDV
jgi:hypothetical protein